jgi:hypothetical protein
MNNRHVFATALMAGVGLVGVHATPALAQAPTVEAELATAIVDRMPEGGAQAFAAEVGEVYAWMRVTGAEGTTIHHVWIRGEDEWSVPLIIGGSPWRTWSSKQIPPEWSGEWRVEIRDESGNMLEALSFTVG